MAPASSGIVQAPESTAYKLLAVQTVRSPVQWKTGGARLARLSVHGQSRARLGSNWTMKQLLFLRYFGSPKKCPANHSNVALLGVLLDEVQEVLPIGVGGKDGLFVIATLGEVEPVARRGEAKSAVFLQCIVGFGGKTSRLFLRKMRDGAGGGEVFLRPDQWCGPLPCR